MNREQMELASASTSSAAPAVKQRSKLAALIAAVIVAAALLFTMPSLAHAAEEPLANEPVSTAQEIPLSNVDSGTSVNKTTSKTDTSPTYAQTDAYATPSKQQAAEGVLVNGGHDSGDSSYTSGDDKSSIKDDDTDSDDSNASANGNENMDDSNTVNGGTTANSKTDNDSTDDSNGALSNVTDEIATGNNQSAHPTGDSNASDVIATPGMNAGQTSADLNASGTSAAVEEVPNDQADVVYTVTIPQDAADNVIIEPTAVTTNPGPVTVIFGKGLSATSFTATAGATMPFATDITWGHDDDPIWNASGNWVAFSKDTMNLTNATDGINKGLDSITRLGYAWSEWYFFGINPKTGKWQKIAAKTFTALSNHANYIGSSSLDPFTNIVAYPRFTITTQLKVSVQYYGSDRLSIGNSKEYAYMDALVAPREPQSGYAWKPYTLSTQSDKALTSASTLGDALNMVLNFRGNSTRSYSYYTNLGITYTMKDVLVYEMLAEDLEFKVNYNPGTGATGTAKEVTYNAPGVYATEDGATTGTKPETAFSRTGYTFAGWATSATGTKLIDSAGSLNPLSPANGQTYQLYALWTPKKYDITYNDNKAKAGNATVSNMPSPLTVTNGLTHGTAYTISNNEPTATGYKFQGWATSANGAVAYAKGATIPANAVTGAITLYAVWQAQVTVSYNLNGGSGTAPASQTVDTGTAVTLATTTTTRTGYTLTGWNTNNGGTGTHYNFGASYTPTANITFYAEWKKNPSIAYNANKPTGALASTNVSGTPSSATFDYNTTATVNNATPTLMGYTFAGWNTAANGTGTNYNAGASIANFTADLTLYAKWTEKGGYSVVYYDAATGSADGTAYYTANNLNWTANANHPAAAPTKAGYNFLGWYYLKDTNGNGDGTKYATVTAFKNVWETAKGISGTGVTDSTTTIKLYAKWEDKGRVSFTLDANGGSYNGNSTYTEGNILNGGSASIPALATIANPSRTGYNFKGWAENTAGTGTLYQAGATFNNLTTSKTLYAKWEAANVTFTFNKGADSGVTALKTPDPYTMTAAYGSNLAVPKGDTVYTRTGYSHNGWTYTNSSNANATVAAAGANVAVANFKITWTGSSEAGNLVGTAQLTANWGPFTYNIVWDNNGGTGVSPTSTNNVNASTAIVLPTKNPTRAGYTFKGWNTAATGSGTTVSAGATVTATWSLSGVSSGSNLTAYAQWEENKVQIRVYGDANATPKWASGTNTYSAGTILYVGAATGAIYANATTTTPTTQNISTGFAPNITNSNYEFNATGGSKWTVGSASGTTVGTTATFTVPKTSNLYVTADYYLTVSPKGYNFTVEYYTQDLTGGGYTKVSNPVGSGTAPFGYTVKPGTSVATNTTTKITTYVIATIAGFTYNASKSAADESGQMNVNNQIFKVYFDRNINNVNVAYTGSIPPSMSYSPATQAKKYGEQVTLTTPTAPTGYVWGGWNLTSTSNYGMSATQLSAFKNAVKAGTFDMPNGEVNIEGIWNKQQFNIRFINSDTTNGTVTAKFAGQLSQSLNYGDSLSDVANHNPKNPDDYYFLGWEVYENVESATAAYTTGTRVGVLSDDAVLGLNASVGTPWVCTSNTVFRALFGKVVAVNYVSGIADGFQPSNGSVYTSQTAGSNTALIGKVITAGTRYTGLEVGWDMPRFGGTTDPAGTTAAPNRNANQPKAAAGYKFAGWEWNDPLDGNTLKQSFGKYEMKNGLLVYTFVSGTPMPMTVDQSYIFTAIWEETTQELVFKVDQVKGLANATGLSGQPKSNQTAKTNETVTLPTAATYKMTKNDTAYTLVGWTTDATYVSGTSPLYTTSFTMDSGEQGGQSIYPNGDGYYGRTLYPVFKENTVSINYAFATGSSSMGTLSRQNEGNALNMASGSAQGSQATANTGHTFKGWYTDAAHTTAVPASWVVNGKITPQKTPDANGVYTAATYYAYFEVEKYDITFQVGDHGTWTDGTSTDVVVNLAYNTQYGSNIPTPKAASGYAFVKWMDADNNTLAYPTTTLAGMRVPASAKTWIAVYEERSGYTVVYETNGGSPAISSKSSTWTGTVDVSPTPSKQGYTFDGWFAKSDLTNQVVAGTQFNNALTQAGIVAGDGTATLTLYAKWTEKTFTLKYQPKYPDASAATNKTFVNKTVKWTDSIPLVDATGADASTLTLAGYDFVKWNSATAGNGLNITNTTKFYELYQRLYGVTDNTKTEATIYGIWDQKTFTIVFMDGSKTVGTPLTGQTWNDVIAFRDYAPTDGSKTLVGWNYTPAGGSQQLWEKTAGSLPVSAFDGTPSPADGSTFTLYAKMVNNTKWTINFNKVGIDGTGAVNMTTKSVLSTLSGYTTPGTKIDITNFNTHNYITEFENQNGTGRRADLKGYELRVLPQTKTTATAAEVAEGATVTFEVFWVEKEFTIVYDNGVTAIGSKPYAGTDPVPASKTAGWNSTNILPDTTPTWTGYKAPKWQYKNSSGTWVTITTGLKVSDIALGDDDNTKNITVRALWETDKVRLTYAVQTGGSAKSSDNAISVTSPTGAKYEDIDASTGTPKTMTATAGAGYTFTGWYKDGVLLTTNATMTPAKDGELFSSATYEARFRALGSIQYTIQHHFQNADGTYTHNAAVDDTRSGQEYDHITLTNDMKRNDKGYTYAAGVAGSIEDIASLTDGAIMKIFYTLNEHDVRVEGFKPGADKPDVLPTIAYPTTGITQAHTIQKYGTQLTLPNMPHVDGWAFNWSVEYTESGAAAVASILANGANVTMPDADVNIFGVWSRLQHEVMFVAGSPAHGTVTAVGTTLPFKVDHGKKLTDASATGNYAHNIVVVEDATYALTGWSYIDATGTTLTTQDPDSIVINANTVFTALWAQTYYLAYSPDAVTGGNHGGTGFTAQVKVDENIKPDPVHMTSEYKLMIGGADLTQNAPAAAGYRFVGWTWTNNGEDHFWIAPAASDYNTAGLAGTAASMDFQVLGNVTFRAIWEALEQNLAFKLDVKQPSSNWTPGGIPGQAGTIGDTYVVDPKPRTDQVVTLLGSGDVHREGYELAGWAIWTDKNGDNLVSDDELDRTKTYIGTFKMPANGVIFAPVWDFKQLTVNYAYGNGSANRGIISNFADILDNAIRPTLDGSSATAKPGYKFGGWYTDAACTTPVDPSWIMNRSDGSVSIIPVRPADGWVPAIYYAQFLPDFANYTIEYYFQGMDGNYEMKMHPTFGDVEAESMADVTDPTNPAYSHLLDTENDYKGYQFNPDAFGQVLSAVVAGDGSTVLKLFYNMLPFDITYDLGTNGTHVGEWVANAGPDSAIAGTTVAVPSAKLEGMKHAGWKVTWTDPDTGAARENVIGTGLEATFTMPAADVLVTAIYAKWIDLTIEYITADGDGNHTFKTETITNAGLAGTTWTIPEGLVNANRPAGYMNPSPTPSIPLVDDVDHQTLKVIYTLVADYKLYLNPNGGEGDQTINGLWMNATPAAFATVNPVRKGYTVGDMPVRWNTKKDGTGMWLDYTTTYGDLATAILGENFDDLKLINDGLTLYAIWSELSDLVVKFDLNNDPATNPNIIKTVPDFKSPVEIDDMTGVRWTQSGFNLNDAEEWNAAPHGYYFAGWNTKADGTGLKILDATKYLEISNLIDENVAQPFVTLYAQWNEIIIKIEYTVTDGGTIDRVIDHVSAVTGQHINDGSSAGTRLTSTATAKPGYHFVGWKRVDVDDQSGLVTMADYLHNQNNAWSTSGSEDHILTILDPTEAHQRLYGETYLAVFEINDNSTIRYHVNAENGTGSIADTVKPYGTPNVAISDGKGFGLKKYSLVRWNTKEDGTGDWYDLGQKITMPEGGLDLYAMWDLNSYGVKVQGRNDHVADVTGKNTKVEWGQPLTSEFISSIKASPKVNSTFAGWHYKMTDADTGEVIEGIVYDLSELTVLGDMEIEALFDTVEPEEEAPAEGTIPKTGDDDFMGLLLAALALIALVASRKAARNAFAARD